MINNSNERIGIYVGFKEFAVISNGMIFKNINETERLKIIEKKLHREQKCLSRKYEKLKKGESTQKNIQKQKLRVQKNRHLSKTVASQKFYEFRTKLKVKCDENGIELRVTDKLYSSSKLCHCCGSIKKDLQLSDRVYRCNCGNVIERDIQAALN